MQRQMLIEEYHASEEESCPFGRPTTTAYWFGHSPSRYEISVQTIQIWISKPQRGAVCKTHPSSCHFLVDSLDSFLPSPRLLWILSAYSVWGVLQDWGFHSAARHLTVRHCSPQACGS